jgi:DNA-binding CsgD family transcriptional regulator
VLALAVQGKSNKEIGAAIAIAENTVKNHLKSVLDKLHMGTVSWRPPTPFVRA